MNPAEPNVEYQFVSGVGPSGLYSGVQKVQFVNAEDSNSSSGIAQLYEHSSQTLVFTTFDPIRAGGLIWVSKATLFFNPETGHNVMLLAGNPRRADQPTEFDRTIVNAYVVDLDVAALPSGSGVWADPVMASYPLTAPAGTPGFPFGSQPSNIDDFYFSPDGQYVMVAYTNTTNAAHRLLDVDWERGTMKPHVMPVTPKPDADVPILRQTDVRENGFFPMRWHHPVFASGASGKTYVVGQPGSWSQDDLVGPSIQYLSGATTIGQLMRFDPIENKFASLTNPAFENITSSRETLSHITATNSQNPGYVFVSYYSGSTAFTATSPAYKGAIVAVDIEHPTGPNGAVVLARHHTQGAGTYVGQPMINASSDGTRVLFHSTWGNYQNTVSTYEINLGRRIEMLASGSVVLRRTSENSVALFADAAATTPIAGSERTVSVFDTLVVTASAGESLALSLDFSAGSPVPRGGVLEVAGSANGGDQLALLNVPSGSDWNWSLTGDGSGQLRGASSGLIRFRGIESFAGGGGEDRFALSAGATWGGALQGGAGRDTLSFSSWTTGVTSSTAG